MSDGEEKVRNQGQESNKGGPCCGPEQRAECCPDIGNADSSRFNGAEMPHAMAKCGNYCRYFLLFPAILGIIFLVLGYYLSPEVIRALWMIGAGMVAGMALLGVLAARRMATGNGFSGCCGAWPGRNT